MAWNPNTTEAYLFQSKTFANRVIMVWEHADINDLADDENYQLIGTIPYNTETHKIQEI